MDIQDSFQWCKCDGQGTCIGCLIADIVRLHLGLEGENYLAQFIPETGMGKRALDEPRKALSSNLGMQIAKAVSNPGMNMGMKL